MRGKNNRVYRSHNLLKIIISTLVTILLILLILFVVVFIWFKQYIVYTSDGVRLEIPWLPQYSQTDG
ncbi:MAG: hypothetical protein IJG63_03305 [Oscillospiraceae bacterium]|nr:hypothetical protein [Oscillospiraceae bacterium]